MAGGVEMTDVDRERVQTHVDEVRDAMGVPNHGVGFRCRVRHDRGRHGLWVRVHEWIDPDEFRNLLAQALGHEWAVRLNGSGRYCRVERERRGS